MCIKKLHNELNNNEYINIQDGEKLDLKRVNALPDNAMLKVKPELWCIWDFKKNNEINLDIWKVTKGLYVKSWWYCSICNDSYHQSINKKVIGRGCSICSGHYVTSVNSLAIKNPRLASQWHPTKNGKLTPSDVTCGKNKKVWWLGTCGHEWEARIADRNRGNNCPYCSKGRKKILKGFNDIWTTNPELASLLANPEDGYLYPQFSDEYVDWKCSCCGEIVACKKINKVNTRGVKCMRCSDGFKYPEKFLYRVLQQLEVDFIKELTSKHFKWIENKRYDFYIPSLNMIIETHGGQHSSNGFSTLGGRTLEEEIKNDEIKRKLALKNNIKYYVELDCSKSEMEHIKNSIIESYLSKVIFLNNINWLECHEFAVSSLVKKVCEKWNNGIHSAIKIAEEMNLSRSCVRRYLKEGATLGLCNYTIQKAMQSRIDNLNKYRNKPVVNVTKNKYFDSAKEASIYYNISQTTIGRVCKGKQKTAGKYKWMYLEDYKKYIEQNKLA